MRLTEFSLPGLDRHLVAVVRWELFVLPDVRDVRPSPIADTVVVVHRGGPRPAAWREALRTAGIGTGQPAAGAGADAHGHAA